jgi:hypothetical protein
MKRIIVTLVFASFFVGGAAVAHADLDVFLSGLNVQAKADMGGFSARLSAQFEVPLPQVEVIMQSVEVPADAFMCFQLIQMTNQEPDVIVQTYKSDKGKGWGVIAQELGVKPGSPEFHAIKNGDLTFTGKPAGKGDNKGSGKGKDKGKGNGQGKSGGKGQGKGHQK